MTSSRTNPTSCDGPGLLAMFESALQLVEANVPELNRLNVFPVPDGDTGTNMYLTLRDVVANTAPVTQDSVSDTSRAMARAALMGDAAIAECCFPTSSWVWRMRWKAARSVEERTSRDRSRPLRSKLTAGSAIRRRAPSSPSCVSPLMRPAPSNRMTSEPFSRGYVRPP